MARSKKYLMKVCKEFFDTNNIIEVKEMGGGHINETYEVKFKDYHYVLQQLNSKVFYSPLGVMNNIRLITDHIKKKVVYEGKNPRRSVLTLIKTRYDQDIAIVEDEYWRCVEYIEGGIGYDLVPNEKVFYEVGRAVGNFQNLLSDFHTRLLDDPIKNFHDTPKRYKNFMRVIKVDEYNRVKDCQNEIDFIQSRESKLDVITSALEEKRIPRRVTHNDTKCSNVMIDEKTGEYLCLIDFDTVMKGSLVYDYGDALRFGASTALEDETDLSKVGINLDYFKAFTEGFLLEMKPKTENVKPTDKPITQYEINLLYEGYYIITLELAMRFLQDYIMGDKYFRVKENRPQHNLERARNQLKLVSEIEKNEKVLKKIINDCLKKLGYNEENLIKL